MFTVVFHVEKIETVDVKSSAIIDFCKRLRAVDSKNFSRNVLSKVGDLL